MNKAKIWRKYEEPHTNIYKKITFLALEFGPRLSLVLPSWTSFEN